jgi:hypothetical protein
MLNRIKLLFSRNIYFVSKKQLTFWENQLDLFKVESSSYRKLNNANYYLNTGRAEILEDVIETIKTSNNK